jgi:hypothetical protein
MRNTIILLLLMCAPTVGISQSFVTIQDRETGHEKKIKVKKIYTVQAFGTTWKCKQTKLLGDTLSFMTRVKMDSIRKDYTYLGSVKKKNAKGKTIWRDTLHHRVYYQVNYKDILLSISTHNMTMIEYATHKNIDRAVRNYQNGSMFNGLLITVLPLATVATFAFGDREDAFILLEITGAAGVYILYMIWRMKTRVFDLINDYRIVRTK